MGTTTPLSTIDPNSQSMNCHRTPHRARVMMGTRTPTRMGTRVQSVSVRKQADLVVVPRNIVCSTLTREEVGEAHVRLGQRQTHGGLEVLETEKNGLNLVPGDRIL